MCLKKREISSVMVWKPVPTAVEDIAGHHHEGVLQTQLPLRLAKKPVEDEPIEQKHYRQEYRELDGVEEHISGFNRIQI